MKIVGIGLNKTGTTTLGECLKYWKFNHMSTNFEAFELFKSGRYDSVLKIVEQYDSFEDFPWPLIYKEIDKKYSHCKFILTTRKSAEIWFRSQLKHAEKIGPNDYSQYIYSHKMIRKKHKDEMIQIYEKHNETVKDYFKDKPEKLLVVCWENGDGWEELAEFLKLEKPNIPFPHAGKAPPHNLKNRAIFFIKRLENRAKNLKRRLNNVIY